jgi:uncharacterized protein YndB with AHSA1/START domain
MSEPLVLEHVVPAPPDEVWRAWTTSQGLKAWWWPQFPDTSHSIDPRPGGAYRIFSAAMGFGVRGELASVEPGTGFVASWVWLDGSSEGTVDRIEVSFAPVPEGTRQRIVHSGPWTGDEGENYRIGWTETIAVLIKSFQ